jgi:geranylgeranyl diphosphate synthase, type II
MDRNESAFRVTFRETLSSAKQMVMKSVAKADAGLCKLMAFALHNQTPSEYPFVLKYAFCRRESDGRKIFKIAAAVHLLQQSSFITDDIFDCGELRYGDPPVYRKYDVNHAVIAAELLQGIALRSVSVELAGNGYRNTTIVFKLFNQMLLDGYVGQYLDIVNSARLTVTLREYYHTIALGAGRIFQNVARCGALLAGKPEKEVRILSRFGYAYGMALFIIDDIIDILPAKQTRKTYASDLKGRRIRLPLILALRLANRSQRELLHCFLRKNTTRQLRVEQVAAVIRDCGALRASQRIANRYLSSSLRSLTKLPAGVTAQRFRWLAERLFQLT